MSDSEEDHTDFQKFSKTMSAESMVGAYRAESTDQWAAAKRITTKIPLLFDGSTSWFKYLEPIDEWLDLTVLEAVQRGPALKNRLVGDAAMHEGLLIRESLRAEDGVKYFTDTLRPHFIKGAQSVFLWRFFQFNRAWRGSVVFTGRFLGFNSIIISKFFIWARENRIGTFPVSSTSTLVEHGGVVGKWIIKLSQRVSVSGKHKRRTAKTEFCRNAIKTTHTSGTFDLPLSIQLTVCNQDPEQRVSDDGQGSKGLMPSMQYAPCHTMQLSNKRNRQLSWNINRLIPRHDCILLHWVFPRLKVQIGGEHVPYPFLFGPCLCLCAGWNHCLNPFLVGKYENHLSKSSRCLSESLSCPVFPWTTKHHHLLTSVWGPVLVLHQRMPFFVPLNPTLPFPFTLPFLLTWRLLNGLDCQAYSLSSHI